jgi:hypothetical protein
VPALENVFAEQDAIKREVGMLRQFVEKSGGGGLVMICRNYRRWWTKMMVRGVFELSYRMSSSGWMRKTRIRLRGRSSSRSRSGGSDRRKNDSHGWMRKRRMRRAGE